MAYRWPPAHTVRVQLSRPPLHVKIIVGLFAGGALGLALPAAFGSDQPWLKLFVANIARPVGDVFLALLLMIVVPLVVSALILGMQELSKAKNFGRVGVLSLLFTIVLTLIAASIGFIGATIVRPGSGHSIAQTSRFVETHRTTDQSANSASSSKQEPSEAPILGLVPKNPFLEMSRALDGGLLPLMVFAIVFGAALAAIPPEKAKPLNDFFDSVFEASQKVVELTMSLAPYAVFFLVFRSTFEFGSEMIQAVGVYFVTVLALLAIHQFGIYGLFIRFIAHRNPISFFRQMRTTMLTAFATSSSNATLPTSLNAAETEVGLRKEVSSFVLTVGATANQNGTALYEGVTILFLAQLFGRDLTTAEMARIFGLTVVAGIGTAGIPSASLPFIATVLASIGLPAPAIGIILGVDRLLDMCRTVLNVTGDMVIAACVDRLVPAKADS